MASLEEKKSLLESRLEEMGSALVAFSAGVDSTLLLMVAHDVLGDEAVALTAKLPLRRQKKNALLLRKKILRSP